MVLRSKLTTYLPRYLLLTRFYSSEALPVIPTPWGTQQYVWAVDLRHSPQTFLEGLIKHKTQAADSWVSDYIKDNADLQEKPSWTQELWSKSKPFLEPLWPLIALPGLRDTWAGSNLTFLSP